MENSKTGASFQATQKSEKKVDSAEISPAQAEVNGLVEKGLKALSEFASFDQEKIDYIVAKMSVAGLDHHGDLARKSHRRDPSGRLRRQSHQEPLRLRIRRQQYAPHQDGGRHQGRPGRRASPRSPSRSASSAASPRSPIRPRPSSLNLLICIKTRNPIIFSFHPKAQESSKAAAIIMRDAAVAAGAPENCIQWIEHPSIEATNALMNHPGISTILATGGNAMVKAAYSCGKPALGVGAGNVPCYINASCDQDETVNDVVFPRTSITA
jgi:acetaldehyde dehydrogenase/alcohol dehydrogenase